MKRNLGFETDVPISIFIFSILVKNNSMGSGNERNDIQHGSIISVLTTLHWVV